MISKSFFFLKNFCRKGSHKVFFLKKFFKHNCKEFTSNTNLVFLYFQRFFWKALLDNENQLHGDGPQKASIFFLKRRSKNECGEKKLVEKEAQSWNFHVTVSTEVYLSWSNCCFGSKKLHCLDISMQNGEAWWFFFRSIFEGETICSQKLGKITSSLNFVTTFSKTNKLDKTKHWRLQIFVLRWKIRLSHNILPL